VEEAEGVDEVEAEPHAVARGFGGDERFADLALDFLWYTDSLIDDADDETACLGREDQVDVGACVICFAAIFDECGE
jgi:hypothetical protein